MALSPAFCAVAARVRNWGRWGDDDELGTVNLIDDAARRRGAAAVRSGKSFPLGLPLSEADGIQLGFVKGRTNPVRKMIEINEALSADPDGVRASEDVLEIATQCATHWDALAHVSYDGHLYNGHPATDVDERGARRCGIEQVTTLVTRGILLDVARARGVDVLEPGYPVTPADLDAAVALAGVEPLPGDVLLVRTGQMVHLALGPGPVPARLAPGEERPGRDLVAYTFPTPGLTAATAEWFWARDAAAVAVDTLVGEVYPGEDEDVFLPVHLLHLVEMGMTQGQNWVLDFLAEDCARDGRYEFLLDATPLPLVGGLGVPVNPVALK